MLAFFTIKIFRFLNGVVQIKRQLPLTIRSTSVETQRALVPIDIVGLSKYLHVPNLNFPDLVSTLIKPPYKQFETDYAEMIGLFQGEEQTNNNCNHVLV